MKGKGNKTPQKDHWKTRPGVHTGKVQAQEFLHVLARVFKVLRHTYVIGVASLPPSFFNCSELDS